MPPRRITRAAPWLHTTQPACTLAKFTPRRPVGAVIRGSLCPRIDQPTTWHAGKERRGRTIEQNRRAYPAALGEPGIREKGLRMTRLVFSPGQSIAIVCRK